MGVASATAYRSRGNRRSQIRENRRNGAHHDHFGDFDQFEQDHEEYEEFEHFEPNHRPHLGPYGPHRPSSRTGVGMPFIVGILVLIGIYHLFPTSVTVGNTLRSKRQAEDELTHYVYGAQDFEYDYDYGTHHTLTDRYSNVSLPYILGLVALIGLSFSPLFFPNVSVNSLRKKRQTEEDVDSMANFVFGKIEEQKREEVIEEPVTDSIQVESVQVKDRMDQDHADFNTGFGTTFGFDDIKKIDEDQLLKRDGTHDAHEPTDTAEDRDHHAGFTSGFGDSGFTSYGGQFGAHDYAGDSGFSSSYGHQESYHGHPETAYEAPKPSYQPTTPSYGASESSVTYEEEAFDYIDYLPIIVGVILITGFSLIFPSVLEIEDVRKKRNSEDGAVNSMTDFVNEIVTSQECMERIACEIGGLTANLGMTPSPQSPVRLALEFINYTNKNYYKQFKSGKNCQKIKCGAFADLFK